VISWGLAGPGRDSFVPEWSHDGDLVAAIAIGSTTAADEPTHIYLRPAVVVSTRDGDLVALVQNDSLMDVAGWGAGAEQAVELYICLGSDLEGLRVDYTPTDAPFPPADLEAWATSGDQQLVVAVPIRPDSQASERAPRLVWRRSVTDEDTAAQAALLGPGAEREPVGCWAWLSPDGRWVAVYSSVRPAKEDDMWRLVDTSSGEVIDLLALLEAQGGVRDPGAD
jgi:hypothetical protein